LAILVELPGGLVFLKNVPQFGPAVWPAAANKYEQRALLYID